MQDLTVVNEYPFNVIKHIYGEQGELKADKEKLTVLMDEAFEKLKEMPDEKELEEEGFEVFELVLSKSIPMAVSFYKYGKTVGEIAEELSVSEAVVHNGLAKVLRKLRHPQISKPLRNNIEWVYPDVEA